MRRNIPRLTIFLGASICCAVARGEMSVQIQLGVQRAGDVTTYNAAAFPFTFPSLPNAPFVTGDIKSADGTYHSYTFGTNQWSFNNPSFTSLPEFTASLEQPWQMTLDEGLATERHYTMSIDLGSLPSTDVSPPAIQFPIHQSIIDALVNPTFTFTTPQPYAWHADLELLPLVAGAGVFAAQTDFAGGTTSWTPSVALEPGRRYDLNIYNNNIPIDGLRFTTPIDAGGNAFPEWHSDGTLLSIGTARFTTVPEPSGYLLAIVGAVLASVLCSTKARVSCPTAESGMPMVNDRAFG
jgi:hypothetical protein